VSLVEVVESETEGVVSCASITGDGAGGVTDCKSTEFVVLSVAGVVFGEYETVQLVSNSHEANTSERIFFICVS
jgi:hypothetical protein